MRFRPALVAVLLVAVSLGSGVPAGGQTPLTATLSAPTTWNNDNPAPFEVTLTLSEAIRASTFNGLLTATNATLSSPSVNSDKTEFTYRVNPTGTSAGVLNGSIVFTAPVPTTAQCAAPANGRLCAVDGRPLSAAATATVAAQNTTSTKKVVQSVVFNPGIWGHNNRFQAVTEFTFGVEVRSSSLKYSLTPGRFSIGDHIRLYRKYSGESTSRGSVKGYNPRVLRTWACSGCFYFKNDSKRVDVNYRMYDRSGNLFMGNHPTTYAPYDYEVRYTPPSNRSNRMVSTTGWEIPAFTVQVTRPPLTARLYAQVSDQYVSEWTVDSPFILTMRMSETMMSSSNYRDWVTVTNATVRGGRVWRSYLEYTITPTGGEDGDATEIRITTIAAATAEQCATSPTEHMCTIDRRPLAATVAYESDVPPDSPTSVLVLTKATGGV